MQLRGDVLLPGKNNVPMRLEMSFTTGRASFRPSGPLQQPDDGRRGKPNRGREGGGRKSDCADRRVYTAGRGTFLFAGSQLTNGFLISRVARDSFNYGASSRPRCARGPALTSATGYRLAAISRCTDDRPTMHPAALFDASC